MRISVGGSWLVGLAVFLVGACSRVSSLELTTSFSVTDVVSEFAKSVESFAQDEPPPPPLPFNPSAPYFDSTNPTNVTAQLGKTAYLHCMVRQLGNKTVAWVRHRDLHILTVASYTYVSDQRFQAYHLADTEDWTLQIRYTQLRDAGTYECQVSTEPKMSLLITLNVVVPQAQILGKSDRHVKTGSTMTLQCVITLCPEPPVFIFWYHEGLVINYASTRRNIQVQTLKEDTTVSRLVISNAQPADSGNYTCAPSDADPTSVLVHVLNGEKPAAMQHGKVSSSERYRASLLLLCESIIVLLWPFVCLVL